MIHRGGCLCGAVSYEIHGEIGPITLCHCKTCRKAQGSAYVAAAPVRRSDFSLLSGEAALREYESSPGKWRAFCGTCGSPIYSRRASEPEGLRLRIGTLDTPLDVRPAAHIFVGARAEWDEIHDDIPRFAAFEPGRGGAR